MKIKGFCPLLCLKYSNPGKSSYSSSYILWVVLRAVRNIQILRVSTSFIINCSVAFWMMEIPFKRATVPSRENRICSNCGVLLPAALSLDSKWKNSGFHPFWQKRWYTHLDLSWYRYHFPEDDKDYRQGTILSLKVVDLVMQRKNRWSIVDE